MIGTKALYKQSTSYRLSAAGLLPVARLMESDMVDSSARRGCERPTQLQFDMSLLAALLDRWWLETHTFHLPVGELTPTLEDVSMLLGLPCAGAAVAAMDVLPVWRDKLLGRFADVPHVDSAPQYHTFSNSHGPTKAWFQQFSAEYMREDANETTVARHLEAYLLWLFGWTLFCTSQGNSVPKHLLPYARAIAEAPLAEVPQYSWDLAMLAATYRGLCTGCVKVSSAEPIFLGCPLLLQLWAYERFPIGRPRMDMSPYLGGLDEDDVNKPTMGSLWCLRRAVWTGVQTKKSYPDFVSMFDALVDTDVRWRPYNFEEVDARALHGLSSLCYRDMAYWRMRRLVVYDIHVEDYTVDRVMRQFGLYQHSPLPATCNPYGPLVHLHLHRRYDQQATQTRDGFRRIHTTRQRGPVAKLGSMSFFRVDPNLLSPS
ncbi:serine/threonine-protein phosphatase 7 long form homolog [Setaria viridis]|uniref:serine/threonine-protein phosphatase 7 long form homolog n=1 Tax=Setaria viridis TaxID=4556 RepID=UPI003B3AC55B